MSYKSRILLALAGLLVIAGCSKETTGDDQPKSTWTIDGITYTEGSTPTSFSSNNFFSSDDVKNGDITIQFAQYPTINTTYPLTDLSDTSTLHPGVCSIVVGLPPNKLYRSLGNTGPKVYISEGANGKLIAEFSNVQIKHTASSDIKTLSGKLIEK